MTEEYTKIDEIAGIVEAARASFVSGKTRPYDWRIKQIRSIKRMMEENEDLIVEALQSDLGRPRSEGLIAEVDTVRAEAQDAIDHLHTWMKDEAVGVPLGQNPASARVRREPLGVVLIIAPWNFPMQLCFNPLVAALAAGNSCVIKPSEVSANCARVIATLLPRYLDTDAIRLVQGAVKETTELLKQRFDHIIYTGNGHVAKIVMRAAAEYLTPVTLELGGKSPAIVDDTCDLELSAKRIIAGKFLNCGQVCIAPDYILVHKSKLDALRENLIRMIHKFYGKDQKSIQASPDLGRVVNSRHVSRLCALLDEEGVNDCIVFGGRVRDADSCYIEPTLLQNVPEKARIMNEEIFGPLLPIRSYETLDEAIKYINAKDKPLAMYIFSKKKANIDRILAETSSGGVTINDTLFHNVNPNLPFGGVGPSGMGAYHGKWGFDTFSHCRAILEKPTWIDPYVRYPPYSPRSTSLVRTIITLASVPGSKYLKPLVSLVKYGLFALAVYYATTHYKRCE